MADGPAPRRSRRLVARKHAAHAWLWRMVEGAVVDAFRSHPDYLTERGTASAVESITKRVVGTLAGAKEVREDGRFCGSWLDGWAIPAAGAPGGGCKTPPGTSTTMLNEDRP